jgi:hypothetical protein
MLARRLQSFAGLGRQFAVLGDELIEAVVRNARIIEVARVRLQ